MTEPIDELLEWLHTFDELQFSCNHRNVIEKIWQIKSKQQLLIPRVVGRSEQLKAFLTWIEKEGGSPFIDKDALIDDWLKSL